MLAPVQHEAELPAEIPPRDRERHQAPAGKGITQCGAGEAADPDPGLDGALDHVELVLALLGDETPRSRP